MILKYYPQLLLLSLLACSSSSPRETTPSVPAPHHPVYVSIYIDKEFKPDDQIILGEVTEEYNIAFHGNAYLHPLVTDISVQVMSDPFGVLLMQVDRTCKFIPILDTPGTVLAWTSELGGRKVWFVRDVINSPRLLHQVALHELGHVFSAPHDTADSLMHLFATTGHQLDCIDSNTALAIQKALGIVTKPTCK